MKKLGLVFIVVCSVFSILVSSNLIEAIDFSKDEAKYIKLCSSSSLTQSNVKVCEDFNEYLSKKNSDIKKEISETKKDLNSTNASISDISAKLNRLTADLQTKEAEINYLLSSIKNIEKDIAKKEALMRERLYVMQTTYNSNWILDFLFGAEDFTTFFSRLTSINDITSYEKELVEALANQKKSLDNQKATLVAAKDALKEQRNTQIAYQDKLISLKASQQNEIASNQKESEKVSEAQRKIDAALTALMTEDTSGSGGSYVPGASATGNAVAKKALTKLGSRYWWGAPGGGFGDGQKLDSPNAKYFDCSGFVAWAHRQSGVMIGRTTAAGYSRSGKAVTRSQLQPGDVITFNYGSGVAHIGIYIGGGSFVHAAGNGSGTRGQYANQCVKTSPLAGYWEKYVYNYRRLY